MSLNTTDNQVDSEKIRHELAVLPKCPKNFVNLFGESNVREFEELLLSDPFVDADTLILIEKLSPEEVAGYVTCLPEFREIRQEMHRIVDAMMAYLEPKLPNYLERTFVDRDKVTKRLSIGHGTVIQKTQHEQGISLDKGLLPIFNAISSFGRGYALSAFSSYRGARLSEFINLFILKFLTKVVHLVSVEEEKGGTNWKMASLGRAIGEISKEYQQRSGVSFMGLVMLEQVKRVNDVVDSNKETFNSLSSHVPQELLKDVDKLKEYNDALFDEILTLSEFRKVGPFRTDFGGGNASVVFSGDNLDHWCERLRGNILCIATVVLDPSRPLELPSAREVDGRLITTVPNNEGAFDVTLDRSQSELCYPSSAIPLHGKGLMASNKMAYEILKYIVFSSLYDHLVAKEPDIEDFWVAKAIGDKISSETVCEDISWKTYRDVGRVDVEEGHDEIPDGGFLGEKAIKTGQLKGLSGAKVVNALTKILGRGPDRISGSHHIFKSDEGKSYPIPVHGKGQGQVPIHIIIQAIKTLEISREDFVNAL